MYLDARRIDEAVALLDELRAVFRASPPGHLLRMAAHVALAAEGVDAALEAHSQAVEAFGLPGMEEQRPGLMSDLGVIQDRAGDHDAAAETFRAAVALSPEARFYRGAGRALRMAGRLDEADADLREALRLVPSDPHAHLEMGLLMETRGNIDASVDHLSSALEVWESADEDFEPATRARAKLEKLAGC